MPRGGYATWWVCQCHVASCCALQHVVRCMLRGVAPPIDGAVQVRCGACCSFDIVCCMMRAAAAALPMAGTPIDAVQVCCGARCKLFCLLRAVERSPLPLRNICVNAYSDQRSSSIASKRVVRCIGARCMLHSCALHAAWVRVACCAGARRVLHRVAWLHRRRAALPAALRRLMFYMAARLGKGRALR